MEHAPFYYLPSVMAYTSIIHILPFARTGGIEFKRNKILAQHKSRVIHSRSYTVGKEQVQKRRRPSFPRVFLSLFAQNSSETKDEQNMK